MTRFLSPPSIPFGSTPPSTAPDGSLFLQTSPSVTLLVRSSGSWRASESPSTPLTGNLNDITTSGIYHQTSAFGGSPSNGYPYSSEPGILEVFNNGTTVLQRYTASNGNSYSRQSSDGSTWTPWETPRGYRYAGTERFTTSGTFGLSSLPWVRGLRVKAVGGGGGGGGAAVTAASQNAIGGGGVGGVVAESFWLVSQIPSSFNLGALTVTIGSGGSGATGATVGGDGGTTSVSSGIIATASAATNASSLTVRYQSSAQLAVGTYITVTGFSPAGANVSGGTVTSSDSTSMTVRYPSGTPANSTSGTGQINVIVASASGGSGGPSGLAAGVGTHIAGSNGETSGIGDIVYPSFSVPARMRLSAGSAFSSAGSGNAMFPSYLVPVVSATGINGLSPVPAARGNGGNGGVNAQSQSTARNGGGGTAGFVEIEYYA